MDYSNTFYKALYTLDKEIIKPLTTCQRELLTKHVTGIMKKKESRLFNAIWYNL